MKSAELELELLPCPFCGSKNIECAGHTMFFISCLTCEAGGGTYPDEPTAIAHWNSRAQIHPTPCECAGMLTVLKAIQPEMRREHDAGDGHFSTSEVEAVESAIANSK